MDVVLEVTDQFLGDYFYAKALPVRAAPLAYPNFSNATERQIFSTWQYKPTTSFLNLQPTKYAYMSIWDRDNVIRQYITLFMITWLFAIVLYWAMATFSYYFVFDHKTKMHPKYLKNQVKMEIKQSLDSMPIMSALTVPFWILDVRGLTKLYSSPSEGPGMWYEAFQFPLFLLFTDCTIYFIHRFLHHPRVYKYLHKAHHKWVVPTPYAAFAFHPVDGWLQSVPYHVFPLVFPQNKWVAVAAFVFVNVWTVIIHDGEYLANDPVLNGAACHTMHHLYFNYNYGQYTTLWDRLFRSYRQPDDDLFKKEAKMSEKQWRMQAEETARIEARQQAEDAKYHGNSKKTD